MWYPAAVTTPVASEPVTIEMARNQVRADGDTSFDTELTRLIPVARGHVERYCGTRIGAQTLTVKCDSFSDMARFPEAPVTSITSIVYVDPDGADQTLATSVYELRTDDLEASIVLKYGQAWPSVRPGSRITVIAVVGYTTPPAEVTHGMLLFIGDQFANHEPVKVDGFTAFDSLLCNHRRGV